MILGENATVPEEVQRCVHDMIAGSAAQESAAMHAWDGILTYGELDELPTQLARYLSDVGFRPGVVVPLCFEKSMWTAVAMLGAMKTRGA